VGHSESEDEKKGGVTHRHKNVTATVTLFLDNRIGSNHNPDWPYNA
jgi:hypothetical protein